MKFDVVLGNPPYQKKVGPKKTEAIWHKFVEKSFEICKEGGYVSLIHPGGWRDVDGIHKDVQKLILSKNVKFLEMHNIKDGIKTFGVKTPYDWYVVQNNNEKSITTINCQDGSIININLSDFDFIPNGMFNDVLSLVAKEGEEKVEILYSRSAYGTDKQHMSKVRTDEHIYPCVYGILKNGQVNYHWSNEIKNDTHLVPKLIFAKGMNPTMVEDYNGELLLTQFAFGVVDTIDNLERIKKVINSEIFQKINIMTKYGATQGNPLVYPKILATFKKDFWKYFLDEDNNVIEPNFENVERI